MDAIFSPYITIAANLLVGFLMSKGIVDNSSRQAAYQLINNAIAALLTLIFGIASIYYAHETHKVNVLAKTNSQLITLPSTSSVIMTGQKSTATQLPQTLNIQQTGLPSTPVSA